MTPSRYSIIFGVFKGMGDLLWAAPVISAELERGAEVHLVLWPSLVDFFPLIDFGPLRRHVHLHVLPQGSLARLRFLAGLARVRPELVWISPHAPEADSSWRVPLLFHLLQSTVWRGAVLAGATTERLSRWFTRPLPVDRKLPLRLREWSAYRLLRGGPVPLQPPPPQLIPEISNARSAALTYDLVIHPGASATNRKWPAGHYAALLAALPKHWKIAVLGLEQDVEEVRAELAPTAPVEYRSGSLRDALCTLADARVLLVMDSGTMHFAEYLGVPAVALFGQQDPAGVVSGNCVVPLYRQSVPCQPCGRSVCSQPKVFCMENLDAESVARALISSHARAQVSV